VLFLFSRAEQPHWNESALGLTYRQLPKRYGDQGEQKGQRHTHGHMYLHGLVQDVPKNEDAPEKDDQGEGRHEVHTQKAHEGNATSNHQIQ